LKKVTCTFFLFHPALLTEASAVSDIHFFNSLTGQMEKENVYGEAFLRYAYGNPLGKIALHSFIKRPGFSQWYGWRMNQSASREKIAPFLQQYGLNAAEFADPIDSYRTFNEFFYRKLKPSARPIDPLPDQVVFPADGRHLAFADASKINTVFVKGQRFDIAGLLEDEKLAARYQSGSLILSRLCPVDYHRFHFPVAGKASATHCINGPLFSVSPIALRQNLSYFWQNKRTVCEIETEHCGKVLMLEIGATCVGTIIQTYPANSAIEKGQEKGYFAFGGSSTILLFEPGAITLPQDFLDRSNHGIETYARMGSSMAKITI
jgi:phosphatidylserine decarboxylase